MRTVFFKWRLLTGVCFFSGFVMFAGLFYVETFLPLESERDGDGAVADAGLVPGFEPFPSPASDKVRARKDRRAVTEHHREHNHSVSASATDATGDATQSIKDLQSEQAELRPAVCEIAEAAGKQLDINESSHVLRSMEYCNHMEDSNHNGQAEGRYASSEYQLMAVAMVMRHGYRSPMYTLPNLVGPRLCCKLNDTLEATTTSKGDDGVLRRFVASANSILASRTPTALVFRRFGLYPNSDSCYGAQLTAHGSLQMLRLGQYFRSRYVGPGRDALLAEAEAEPTSKVYVRTTEYSRTFQSAAAFLFGLLSPTSAEFGSVRIETTKSLFLCSESSASNLSCNCRAAGMLAKSVDGQQGRTGGLEAMPDRRLRLELARIFNVSANRLPHNGALLEVFMSHVCHGLALPCPTGNALQQRQCITWTQVNDIWQRLDVSGRQRLQIEDHRSLSRLLSFPLFHEIIQNFRAIVTGERRQVFYLYSGHDKTISATVDALGTSGDGRWPPFGARIVFELLRHRTSQNRFFVRLLVDGTVVTDRLLSSGLRSGQGQSEGRMDGLQAAAAASERATVTSDLISLDDLADLLLNRSFRKLGKFSYTDACG